MMHIDKDTYRIKKYNRYNTTPNKIQIIISFSLRKNNYHITHLQHKEYGRSKKWNTYSISRDGEIFEHYKPKYYTDYMGIKDVDKKSISIVVENMCSLLKNDNGDYINWLNELCPKDNVIEKKFFGSKYWELITEKQYDSVIVLCNYLCEQFNIPKKIIDFHYYNENVKNFKGIVFKSNYFENSTAIHPLFDIQKIKENIK
jgi:hypothetical protein